VGRLEGVSRAALYGVLVWAPLASGAYQGWPLTVTFLLVGLGVAVWAAAAVGAGRLEWRRTPLDLPVALLLVLVGVQLAIGNRALVAWALAPATPVVGVAADFPAPFLAIGTVAPRHTATAALTFVGYAAVYALVVQTVRTRRQVGRLVRTLLVVGGVVAFAGLVDYLAGEAALTRLRGHAFPARLSGTFANPDHFAAWLAMLIALGLGWVASRAPASRRARGLGTLLSVRELREQAVRRHLPLVAIAIMAIALVFTLSRGGLVNVVAGLLTLLALLRVVGRVRRSLVVTGALLLAVLGYGGWIGFGPVLARLAVTPEGTAYRLDQYVASLPMLREFPVLGVGLGAYREIYFRHQPLAHQPETLYFPHAHNDLLQLALELGPAGILLGGFVAWRLAADLVGVHLLGRGACPVDGGVGPSAVRSDRTSLGIAIGALAGVAGLVVHSALDFSARIPAVGIFAATLLGLATVALHTRLHPGHEQLLSGTAALDLGRARRRVVLGAVAAVLVGGWAWTWVHQGRVHAAEAALLTARPAQAPARAAALLALDARNPQARLSRARARQAEALRAWESPSGVHREARARVLLAQARDDLHVAIAATPSNPWLHLDLAWVEASNAVVQGRGGAEGLATALAHGARAVALGRNSPLFYAGMARLAYSVPELSLRAAREGVARRASLMPEMIALYRPLGLTDAEWLTVVPATAVDQLELAILLERGGLRRPGLHAFRAAAAAAPAEEAGVYRWALGEALARAGAVEDAVEVLRTARATDAGNVELARSLGAALAHRGDPEALDHLRAAAAGAERLANAADRRPFPVASSRLARLVEGLAGDLDRPGRYQRALAAYLTERRLWEPALEQWRAVLATEPRDAEARFGRGLVLEATGATGEALDDFRAAVTLDPRAPRYRRRLAERLWQSEQFFQAINEWRALKEQQPGDVDTRLTLARAYERVGQPTDAYREFREVLALTPGQPEAARAVARMEGRGR
jgi:tetratricopeptide (TPR) repeat protein/O-antigen ligase